jgi:uncharacterized protein YcfJ
VKAGKSAIAGLAAVALVSGCATTPFGPTYTAVPPPNKPAAVFDSEDAACRGRAADAVQGQVAAANNQQVGATLFTAILGTALGATFGGARGAAIGAAAGAGAGGIYGVNSAQWQQLSIQQRYNVVYAQCMYARGNSIPGYPPPRHMHRPPPSDIPPPPPGAPPPPPENAPPGPSDE